MFNELKSEMKKRNGEDLNGLMMENVNMADIRDIMLGVANEGPVDEEAIMRAVDALPEDFAGVGGALECVQKILAE